MVTRSLKRAATQKCNCKNFCFFKPLHSTLFHMKITLVCFLLSKNKYVSICKSKLGMIINGATCFSWLPRQKGVPRYKRIFNGFGGMRSQGNVYRFFCKVPHGMAVN